MATLSMVFIICLAAICISAVLHRQAIEVIPVLFFTVIVVLFPFYCMDVLRIGRMALYALLLLAILIPMGIMARKGGMAAIRSELSSQLSPSVYMFLGLSLFFFVYTFGNHVILWDELHLWGAVPKALWATERLQVGTDALIFSNMQSYPPAMPLFIYFLIALASQFPEHQIHLGYALFVSALFLSAMGNLKRNQKREIAFFTLLVIVLPWFFTSQMGDSSCFYATLFIDPVLGMMAGYCFWLSINHPFSSVFGTYRFCAALIVLTLLKDSGTSFAFAVCIHAVLISILNKADGCTLKKKLMGNVLAIASVGIAYFVWQSLISGSSVKNHLSFHDVLPSLATMKRLIRYTAQQPMWAITGVAFSFTLTFFACVILLVCADIYITRRYQDVSKKVEFVSVGVLSMLSMIFVLGMCSIFGRELPSFSRYVSTLLACAGTYLILRWSAAVLHNPGGTELFPNKLVSKIAWSLCGIMLFSNFTYVRLLQIGFPVDFEKFHAENLLQQLPEGGSADAPISIYLFAAEDDSWRHFRTYLELLGTRACIRNDAHDGDYYEYKDDGTVEKTTSGAQAWMEQLSAKGYEYVYVMSADETDSEIMKELGYTAEFEAESLYKVEGNVLIKQS